MKILLIGKNGQVGWELRRTCAPLGDVVAVDYPDVNFTDIAGLRRLVSETRPAVVINAAAYTAVDKAETEKELCHQINATGPGVLAEEAKKIGALIVHYSTDYIFDGTKQTAYVETDAPNPLGSYGVSKLAGDEAVRTSGAVHLIFRLCWVYGARGQNFMLTMQRLAREREKLRVVRDQFGCPTWSRMIAEATAQAIRQTISGDRKKLSGTYHLASTNHTNWHGFASRIIELMPEAERKCREVEAIASSEYPTPAKRPAHSVLNCDKLENTFGLRLPDWETSLLQVLDKA
ncbi:MAG TPA: dTDP-4-dehydrorhamnose reductase [Verrucomicrobiota bacterium]|nr:dTDP-4-dehydrorhamnose reductase [Verrucomicrobiota bacterium]